MNEVQERELSVLKEIVKVCERHHLRYFAIGGTCIGAVRHQGFIPWDDDIDIGMPRRDYELFRNHYYAELPEYLHKLDCDNSAQHSYLFTKIHDSRTAYVEYYAKDSLERYTGAFVDVMPVDGLPKDSGKERRIVWKLILLGYLNARNRPIPFRGDSVSRVLKYCIKRIFRIPFHYNFFSDKVLSTVSRYDFNTSEDCIFTWRAGSLDLPIKRIVFRKEWFNSEVEVPFEDMLIKLPVAYDAYLKQDFGDYMTPPPKEQQHSIHDVYINDMNTPCEFYASRDSRRRKRERG